MSVLGQTSALRNVRWTVGDEADMYVFHDGYQIFRKVSLHRDYIVEAPALPPPTLASAVSEGEVLQEVNGSRNGQEPGDDESNGAYALLAAPEEKWPHSAAGESKSPISEMQSKLKEKLINDDILKKTKHFFKGSVAPILEKTTTSFLRPSSPNKDMDTANTSNDSTAEIDTALQYDQTDQPLAFASKAEQLRRQGTLQLVDSDELVVRTIKKKKRRRKKGKQALFWLYEILITSRSQHSSF